MKRFARTRSENRASHPEAGRAQWSVGSIDEDGIRYGLTTKALTRRTIATAPTIVTAQSTTTRTGSGSPRVRRSTGLRERRREDASDAEERSDGVGGAGSAPAGGRGISAGVVGHPADGGCSSSCAPWP